MMDTIARTGSFAAAARELGKVPSALTYSVRQLEDALDVLLFDRSSRQARLTAAGTELLNEGRRLLAEMDAVANRVHRVSTGWETQLTIAADAVVSRQTLFELCEAFYALRPPELHDGAGPRHAAAAAHRGDGRHRGGADAGLGRPRHRPARRHAGAGGHRDPKPLGEAPFVYVVAPHHPLASAERAAHRRRDEAAPRRGRRRLGAAHVAADRQPPAGPGRAHRQQHAGQARGADDRPGRRLPARGAGARARRRRAGSSSSRWRASA